MLAVLEKVLPEFSCDFTPGLRLGAEYSHLHGISSGLRLYQNIPFYFTEITKLLALIWYVLYY